MSDPSPFAYTDYRAWLTDWFRHRRGRPSMRSFAKAVHCSPTLVSQICRGLRNLGEARAERWIGRLGLEKEAASYFLALVRAEEADSPRQRAEARRTIDAYHRLQGQQAEIDTLTGLFGHWLRPVLHEMAHLEGFPLDAAQIKARLGPPVDEGEVADALQWLLDEGLVEDVDGEVRPRREALASEQTVASPALSEALHDAHFDVLAEVADWLYHVPPAQKNYAMTVAALTEAQHDAIREELVAFQRRVMQIATGSTGDARKDRVYQLSMQWFPLTVPPDD